MPPGVLTPEQGTQMMGAANDQARQQALYSGLIGAGAGILEAPNLMQGLGAGLRGFDRGFNTELIANRPKVTPLANGAFSQVTFPDGRVEVVSNDQVQNFLTQREDQKQARSKPPTGLMWNPQGDQLIPIPGGPVAAKDEAAERATNVLIPQMEVKAQTVTENLDKALDQVNWRSAGFVGEIAGIFGGTEATDLQSTIDTIIANIGFKELQDMRASSPTGGALGQVAVKELEMLQAVLGSLKRSQSPEQLKENIKKVRERYETTYNSIRALYEADGKQMAPIPKRKGAPGTTADSQTQPSASGSQPVDLTQDPSVSKYFD
jgi:hypothetical protein